MNTVKTKLINNKKIIENFSYLSIIQLINIILPLITYPYLIRILGKETYGLTVFFQAIVSYLVILISFGFNISATKEISINRDNKTKLEEIVSSVLIIKGLIFFLLLILFILVLPLIEYPKSYKILLTLTMWMALYEFIFPIWYFQGIENMKHITLANIISRMFFFLLIFILIKNKEDYILIPAINGIGAILASVYSLYIIFYKDKIKFEIQPYKVIYKYFKDSIPIFISNISIKLYVSANKVILGSFLGMTEVAYYDLAEKITSILKLPQSILSQSLFPKINKEKNKFFISKVFKYSLIINCIITILTIFFSKYIILLLGGKELLPSLPILYILLITVPVIAMSNVYGIQLLIPFNYENKFTEAILFSTMFYLFQLAILFLSNVVNIYTITLITLSTEVFVTGYMYYYCKKLNLWKRCMTT